MKVRLVVVGGVRGPLAEVVREYEKRAERYWRFEVEEVAAGTAGKKVGPDQVRAVEGERLLSRLPERGRILLLSRDGKGMSSPALANLLEQAAVRSEPEVCFVIGGAFGVADPVRQMADQAFSLSSGTLPHELARLILTEQIYRAGTILRNEPYHKGTDRGRS